MDQRLEQLEMKVAYLEKANVELSDELFRQRQAIEALRGQIATLAGRLEVEQTQTAYLPEEEKPPHY